MGQKLAAVRLLRYCTHIFSEKLFVKCKVSRILVLKLSVIQNACSYAWYSNDS